MATIQRTDFNGAIHHIYGRGNNKQNIFLDDGDRLFFIKWLNRVKGELKFKIYAYCLMSNHYHLLIETGPSSLSIVMGRILSIYAQRFHRAHGSSGHVFQGPYRDKLCRHDASFLRILKYIHLNPVAAGMVKDPKDWHWSGHQELARGFIGIIDHAFPLSFFAVDIEQARRKYREFVADLVIPEMEMEFVPAKTSPEAPLRSLLEIVAQEHGILPDRLLSGSREHELTPVKRALVSLARERGYRQSEIARLIGCSNSALSNLCKRQKVNK